MGLQYGTGTTRTTNPDGTLATVSVPTTNVTLPAQMRVYLMVDTTRRGARHAARDPSALLRSRRELAHELCEAVGHGRALGEPAGPQALGVPDPISPGRICSTSSRTSRVSAGAAPLDEMAMVKGGRRTTPPE